jgi:hypothetical protein
LPDLPSTLSLTTIANGSNIVSADHRNNYTAIQNAINALKDALSGGSLGQVLRATDTDTVAMAYPPGYEYTHTAYTAPVAVTATTEATANTIVTAGAVTFDGSTDVVIEFFAPGWELGAIDTRFHLWLYDGSSSIGRISNGTSGERAVRAQTAIVARRRITPSAAAHTYSIRASVAANTLTVYGGAGGVGNDVPGYIRITKV